jgi:hypothetical protein
VPPDNERTLYHPIDAVQIIVPAGAWGAGGGDASGRRADAPPALTVVVLRLPAGLGPPVAGAEPCGPAVFLGPGDWPLAASILVTLPCSLDAADSSTPAAFRFAPGNGTAAGAWVADGGAGNLMLPPPPDGALWASTAALGLHAAFLVPPPPPGVDATAEGGGVGIGVLVGSVVGAAACASVLAFAAWHLHPCRRSVLDDDAPVLMGSPAGGDACPDVEMSGGAAAGAAHAGNARAAPPPIIAPGAEPYRGPDSDEDRLGASPQTIEGGRDQLRDDLPPLQLPQPPRADSTPDPARPGDAGDAIVPVSPTADIDLAAGVGPAAGGGLPGSDEASDSDALRGRSGTQARVSSPPGRLPPGWLPPGGSRVSPAATFLQPLPSTVERRRRELLFSLP